MHIKFKIHGMHCASCELQIEESLKKVNGVQSAHVSYAAGEALLTCVSQPSIADLQRAVNECGYRLSSEGSERKTARDYLELGAIFLLVMSAYQIGKALDFLPKLGVVEGMSYGFIFLIGLVAALSTCIAVTGGLLLSMAARYSEKHPELTGFEKIRPHIFFNLGRIVSYTFFGAAIGAFGSLFTLSPRTNGLITIVASIVMIVMGFQLLHLFPGISRIVPRMPKFLGRGMTTGASRSGSPFLLGAGTFFLPCGFTLGLQLYVLSNGEALSGALTMFFFSLGTLPALISLSAISNFSTGAFKRYVLKFAGVIAVLLGFFNINNGLVLAGSSISFVSLLQSTSAQSERRDGAVPIVDGRQVVSMKINGLEYEPSRFTVTQGIPLEWKIDGRDAVGCSQVVTVPKLGLTEYIPRLGTKTVRFTPRTPGAIRFGCSMAMTTRGAKFLVVPNTNALPAAEAREVDFVREPCNPEITNCIQAQALAMEVSEERGFYPNSFSVKRGLPVELTVDVQVPLGGCMSVLTIPEYDLAMPLKFGKQSLRFVPTELGTLPVTCSMGIPMVEITVIP